MVMVTDLVPMGLPSARRAVRFKVYWWFEQKPGTVTTVLEPNR